MMIPKELEEAIRSAWRTNASDGIELIFKAARECGLDPCGDGECLDN